MTCTLTFGVRIVLQAEGGPPEAEYALFDPGEIELASTGPGSVREAGYRTTAGHARQRLESLGVTHAIALEAADAMRGGLGALYARGPVVRRIASLLGPGELFEGRTYDADLQRYEGAFLDLPALGLDLGLDLEIARATVALQAFHLSAWLQDLPEDTPVVLSTKGYSRERRPGERSFKRVAFGDPASLPAALRALSSRRPRPSDRDEGPSRSEVMDRLGASAAASADPQARTRLHAIEALLAKRERPSRGVLVDRELWALEEQLSQGDAAGVFERLDEIERQRGRDPATAYLRARASLLTGREPAAAIAARAEVLAMSMSSFSELMLLTAEAWALAGQLGRALPFARDLAEAPGTHEELRSRALEIVASAGRAGHVAQSVQPAAEPPPPPRATLPPLILEMPSKRSSFPAGVDLSDVSGLGDARGGERGSGNADETSFPLLSPDSFGGTPPREEVDRRRRTSPLPSPGSSFGLPLNSELPTLDAIPAAPRTGFGERPTPPSRPRPPATPAPLRRPSLGPSLASGSPGRAPRTSAWPMSELEDRTPDPAPIFQEPGVGGRPSQPLPSRQSSPYARGASQPPYGQGSALAPPTPPPRPASVELAEHLTFPSPGPAGEAPDGQMPSTVVSARAHFTQLSRELGREYRMQRGVELVADISGIEIAQAYLLERYAGMRSKTDEDALDLRRHGAFLSEILARSLGAFWVDVAPTDVGYWAMVLPPDTRVWPFGRILRFLSMGHKERDLVAYYLELQARSRLT